MKQLKYFIKRYLFINRIKKFFKNKIFTNLDGNKSIKSKHLVFYCCVWGDEYLNNFFDFSIPSLFQSENIPALENLNFKISFNIYSEKKSLNKIRKKIEEKARSHNLKLECIQLNSIESKNILYYFIDNMKYCISKCTYCFQVNPDYIYANGIVKNSIILSENKNCTLALPHPRISHEKLKLKKGQIINFLENENFSSKSLIDLLTPLSHKKCFLDAFDNIDFNTTHRGLSIRKIGINKFAVVHSMPSPYFYNFHLDDIEYFSKSGAYNEQDRGWSEFLYLQNRLKIINNSDICFNLEITNDSDGPSKNKFINKYNDRIEKANFYNYSMNAHYTIWAGNKEEIDFN
tara:strand:+ start:8634 stop:9671 length:1038 start_codon:yes stop_codon:yes gene_type:complete